MQIQVANRDHPEKRLWLELPVGGDFERNKMISRLTALAAGPEDEIPLCVTDVHSPVPGLREHILRDAGENSMEQINRLAQKMAVMDDWELRMFSGALKIGPVNGMEDIHRIADGLDNYELFPDVHDERGLGLYLVESGDVEIHESARRYVDYAIIGAEYMSHHPCVYTDGGLVVQKEEAAQSRAVVFDLMVTSPYYAQKGAPDLRLTLPASEERLTGLAEKLRLPHINDCAIVHAGSPIADLNKLAALEPDILTLNALAAEVEQLSQTDGRLMKLCAVLEAEKPDDTAGALKVTINLDDYELISRDVCNAWDYGYHVLYGADLGDREIEFQDEVKDFIDFEKYGKWRMREDGVWQTAFGLVRRMIGEPFPSQRGGMDMRME